MQHLPFLLRRSLLLPAAILPFFACAAPAAGTAESAPATFTLAPGELDELVAGALEHAAFPAARDGNRALAVHVVGTDAPLPSSSNGLELVPVVTFAWSADRPCAELAITDRIGDELFLELRLANPIGGPTVTALRFARHDEHWSWVETLGVTEYL